MELGEKVLQVAFPLGLVAWVVGVPFFGLGIYGVAGGMAALRVYISIPYVFEVVLAGLEAAQFFSVVGILLLLCGIVVFYMIVKPPVMSWYAAVLASCSFVVPAAFFGMGRNLIGGILINLFGYPTLALTFVWLGTDIKEIRFESMRGIILYSALFMGFVTGLLVGLVLIESVTGINLI